MDTAVEIHDVKHTFFNSLKYIEFLNELKPYIDANLVQYVGCFKTDNGQFDKDIIYEAVRINQYYGGRYIKLHHFDIDCEYPSKNRSEEVKEFLIRIRKVDSLMLIVGFVNDYTDEEEIESRQNAAKDFYKKIKQYAEIPTNIHFHED
jgi:hypothetical protein